MVFPVVSKVLKSIVSPRPRPPLAIFKISHFYTLQMRVRKIDEEFCSRFSYKNNVKVPLRRKFCIPFSLQLLKVEVINTYHAKFYIEIPTGRPVILIVKFSFVLPPLLDSKNGREPNRELDLVAPRGI